MKRLSRIINERNDAYDGFSGRLKKWEDYDWVIAPNGEKINMDKLLDDQARARTALIHLVPYFAEFIGKFRFIYTFQVPTQSTDGRDIFINPQFTANLSFDGKVFVMAHEIMHCVLNHLRRSKAIGADHYKANVAADYECNITLTEMGVTGTKSGSRGDTITVPIVSMKTIEEIGALIDKKYSGWGFEKIYKDNPPGPSNMQNQGGSGKFGKPGQGQSGPWQKPKKPADWIRGWNQAIEDYKAGKLKL